MAVSKEQPLMLHEQFARQIPGVTRDMIEAAKVSPQPCPDHWPVPQAEWKIISLLRT